MLDATRVKQLSFSEIYLGHPQLGDVFVNVPGTGCRALPAGPALREDMDRLTLACRQAHAEAAGEPGFRVVHDGGAYRVSLMGTVGGLVFVLRRLEPAVRTLAETGIAPAYFSRLMERGLSGLFIVSGDSLAGKTATACALLQARLQEYGGIAVTVEAPVELPLEGRYRDGVCYQTRATAKGGGLAGAFRRSLHWGAATILVGEIADSEIAAEVLQASVDGPLIISTMQAASVVKTVARLQALAIERFGPERTQVMLADGLAGVLHQRFPSPARKKPDTEFLFLKDALSAKASIRQGRFEALASEMRQQVASMIVENATFRHVGK